LRFLKGLKKDIKKQEDDDKEDEDALDNEGEND
jgi:hypothetical protein